MGKIKKEYGVAAFAMLIMLVAGFFYAWSLFTVSLKEIFTEWNAKDTSLNFTLFIMCFSCGGLLAGRLHQRIGKSKVLIIATIMTVIGMQAFATIKNANPSSALYLVYLFYGVICGVATGMVYNTLISGVSALFPKRSGIISGVLLMCFGFGSLIIGGIMSNMAGKIGIFTTFRIMGVIYPCLVLIGAFIFRGIPEEQKAENGSNQELTGMSIKDTLKSPDFWLYFAWCTFTTCSGLLVINSAANIALFYGTAAVLGMIVSIFNGMARLGIGAFFDRYKGYRSIILIIVMSCSAAISLLASSFVSGVLSIVLMFFGLIVTGASYGSVMSLNASAVKTLFGPKDFSTKFSLITLSGIPASIIGPYVSGVLRDASGGQYTTTFAAMIGFSCVALVCFLCLSKRRGNTF